MMNHSEYRLKKRQEKTQEFSFFFPAVAVRTYTGTTGRVPVVPERSHWGPEAVYQAEQSGAPESGTQWRFKRCRGGGVRG